MKSTLFATFATILLAGLGAAQAPDTQSEFTRLAHPTPKTEALETRAERLVPADGKGPIIWLVSAAHIGEASYYKAIQKLLDEQSLVLYEGVKKDEPAKADADPKKPFPNKGKSTYLEFAKAVGLDFQLDDIDYDRKTFKNCDLTWDEVKKLSAKEGKATRDTVNQVGQLLDANSAQARMLEAVLTEIRKDPAEQAAMRVFLAEFLSKPGAMDKILGSQTTNVLIRERNAKVLHELRNDASQPSIAIFFGAGHMADMEHRLIVNDHYRPQESVWFQAITADPSKVTGQGTVMLSALRSMLSQTKKE